MISCDKLTKVYQDIDAELCVFKDLSFTVDNGQTVALMGQSGSGKSTLLHLLGGFDKATSGEIIIGDKRLDAMNDAQLSGFRRAHLGMIFQQYNLLPCLSAKDNITFVRRLNGEPAMDEATEQLIDVLGLSDRLNHLPAQLSGGEQQRVAIARALAANPKVLLADEPTGNLDERTAAQVMELLIKAVEINQVTLLLVTHSRKTASYLQQTWHLEQGILHC